ncbi:hypothetical protein LWI29_016017 [Acer saccharum]|uniref:Uncharacterized protein n=1 Tax=Acer saccharum TaxID=4024 RepID=A0AA39VDN0_ACESA|nr:hypothetical protein LWI29_016017 [Acer saccharum]
MGGGCVVLGREGTGATTQALELGVAAKWEIPCKKKFGDTRSSKLSVTLRNSSASCIGQDQEPEVNIKVLLNLEEEITKVMEKRMAMGFYFNGRKEELMEIMTRRGEGNDNKFRDLVRRLVSKYKTRDP